MRVVATEYVSLDGVFEEPGRWSGPWFDEEAGRFKWAELQAADALLLGRRTYEGFAAAWPGMIEQTGEFGVKMNTMPKYVVSATLEKAEWSGAELVTGDVLAKVRELRAAPGGDLLLAGSAQLLSALRAANLVDLYRLMVYPVVLGSGARLFTEAAAGSTPLTLASTRTIPSGVVVLEYEPAPAGPGSR